MTRRPLVLFSLAVSACAQPGGGSSSSGSGGCAPGTTVTCECPGGGTGTRLCDAPASACASCGAAASSSGVGASSASTGTPDSRSSTGGASTSTPGTSTARSGATSGNVGSGASSASAATAFSPTSAASSSGATSIAASTSSSGSSASSAASGPVDFDWPNWPLPPDRSWAYTYDADTVIDDVTGLQWERRGVAIGAIADAQTHCDGLSLAGLSGWRLPSVAELTSIVDYEVTYSGPSPSRDIFLQSQWQGCLQVLNVNVSATPGTSPGWRWVVAKQGYVLQDQNRGDNCLDVRCVR